MQQCDRLTRQRTAEKKAAIHTKRSEFSDIDVLEADEAADTNERTNGSSGNFWAEP